MAHIELTKEMLEQRVKEFFGKNKTWDSVFPVRYEWEEDGKKYSCWKIGDVYTGDGGKAMLDEAFKNAL